jgi:hypothetical protein
MEVLREGAIGSREGAQRQGSCQDDMERRKRKTKE